MWGVLAFTLAYSSFAGLFIEFGFGLSATKEVALKRDDCAQLSRIFGEVIGAQIILTVLVLSFTRLIQKTMPVFQENSLLLWLGVSYAIAQGFNLYWFFRGLERMRVVAFLDIASKLLGTTGIFILVHSQEDIWKVLLSYAASSFLSVILGFMVVYRIISFELPTLSGIFVMIKNGFHLFLVRVAASFFSAGNILILGLFVSPVTVGYFAGADKILNAIRGLLTPIIDASFPRLSYMVSREPKQAVCLIRKMMMIMVGIGALLGGATFLSAPVLVSLLLGDRFTPSIPVLQILAILPLVIGISHVLGSQWMVPLGLQRSFSLIVLGGGILNLLLSCSILLFAPAEFAIEGVAFGIVATHFSLMTMYIIVLNSRKLNPFSTKDLVIP